MEIETRSFQIPVERGVAHGVGRRSRPERTRGRRCGLKAAPAMGAARRVRLPEWRSLWGGGLRRVGASYGATAMERQLWSDISVFMGRRSGEEMLREEGSEGARERGSEGQQGHGSSEHGRDGRDGRLTARTGLRVDWAHVRMREGMESRAGRRSRAARRRGCRISSWTTANHIRIISAFYNPHFISAFNNPG
jgi:hypothetical protein